MRRMWDSTNPNDIPPTAEMVAGYVNGIYQWSQSGWDRFSNAVKVRIATRANVNDGHVLDVETGAASPNEAPAWVLRRRAAGIDPTVYCNKSTWVLVRNAFKLTGVAEPHYWIADWDEVSELDIPGAIAKQYVNPPHSGGHYDLSIVADYWPGVDEVNHVSGEADFAFKFVADESAHLPWVGHHEHPGDWLQDFRIEVHEALAAIRADIAALKTHGFTLRADGEITVTPQENP